ncbi:MAG TPA: SpoIID/LytB domain-containing protein [Gemmatimonadales bacterium]|nr:SpoIID/LytB domain-containing protein [Gemmatimonadales bacterium]
MAITAAERRVLAGAALVVVAGLASLGSCTPGAPPAEQPAPEPIPRPAPEGRPDRPVESAEPRLRIGLAVGVPSASVGGAADLVVTDPAGARLAAIPGGEQWRVVPSGVGVSVQPPGRIGSTPSEMIAVAPSDPTALLRVNGRSYRGILEIVRDTGGITLVNRLPLETYLLGVVSAEMGRRNLAEFEALKAQAVVSRTYALRNLGRRAALGFDLHAGVADQVYVGAGSEAPEGLEAVQATRGMVLTHGGAPIDAFYYSTCGGQTADGVEAFAAASRSYLRSFPDVDQHGEAYCRISPRYRWREEWTGGVLLAMLRRTLPTVARVSSDRIGEVRDVWVAQRTASGRVGRLAITLASNQVMVDGPAVRQVLRPPSGDLLRSAAFTLTATGAGRGLSRLVAEGRGAGHGVGLCQWGAVGRSRAGQDFQRILAAYYPGATLQRLY